MILVVQARIIINNQLHKLHLLHSIHCYVQNLLFKEHLVSWEQQLAIQQQVQTFYLELTLITNNPKFLITKLQFQICLIVIQPATLQVRYHYLRQLVFLQSKHQYKANHHILKSQIIYLLGILYHIQLYQMLKITFKSNT